MAYVGLHHASDVVLNLNMFFNSLAKPQSSVTSKSLDN